VDDRQADFARPGRTALAAALLLGLFLALTTTALAHPASFAVELWWADVVVAHRGGALAAITLAFNAVGLFPWSLIIVALATLVVWRTQVVADVATLPAGEVAS
jgi:hypothetical protein